MVNTDTKRQQLISEVEALRRRMAELKELQAEHNRVEEELWESEERYRTIVDLGTRVGEAVVVLQDTEEEGFEIDIAGNGTIAQNMIEKKQYEFCLF